MKFSSLKRFSSTKQDLIRFSNPLDSWQLGNLGKQDYDIDIDPDHHDHNQYHWMDPVKRIQEEASQYSLGFHASSRLILNEEEEDFDKLYFYNNSIFLACTNSQVLDHFTMKECLSYTSITPMKLCFTLWHTWKLDYLGKWEDGFQNFYVY